MKSLRCWGWAGQAGRERRAGAGLFYHNLMCQWSEFSALQDVLVGEKGVAWAACLRASQHCPEATWREGVLGKAGQF